VHLLKKLAKPTRFLGICLDVWTL